MIQGPVFVCIWQPHYTQDYDLVTLLLSPMFLRAVSYHFLENKYVYAKSD